MGRVFWVIVFLSLVREVRFLVFGCIEFWSFGLVLDRRRGFVVFGEKFGYWKLGFFSLVFYSRISLLGC